MAKYILLGNWTDQGAVNVKETVERARAAREAFAAVGVSAREWFFTMGHYDVVLTVEAPDSATLAKATLALTALGNLRVETLPSFGVDEMDRIIKDMR
ncbi:GYD domain-containing protein [Thiohalocapsa marina]|uniref:GYD domain-containing protein n=1 Tax=Thiohalocapsa marina TaxID=424902 RepID=A0A5M8FET1_9GAMM|nr:GYD domain-containing protein [Thiohalocapsa marina]KAA6183187.1 GYD domain-containing protein [Thiohalocapsa marina]